MVTNCNGLVIRYCRKVPQHACRAGSYIGYDVLRLFLETIMLGSQLGKFLTHAERKPFVDLLPVDLSTLVDDKRAVSA